MAVRKWVGYLGVTFCVGCGIERQEDVAQLAFELKQGGGLGIVQAGDEFGAVLATGNFNNDAYDDLIVGSPGEDSDAGAIFVYMGSASGLNSGFFIKQSHSGGTNTANDRFGAALATGNLNNDAYDDLVVGIPGKNSGAGTVGVWLGSSSGLSSSGGRFFGANAFDCGGGEPNDEFGAALAIGDFNFDGFDDLAVGAPGENTDTGWVCVVKGRTGTGVASGQGHYYNQATLGLGSTTSGDRFGAAMSAGKLTSGSHIDLAIGSPGENTEAGTAMVFFGNGNASTTADQFFVSGVTLFQADPQPGDHFGESVLVKNLNLDSYDDLVVGMPNAAFEGEAGGRVVVFRGKSSGPSGTGAAYQQTGSLIGAGTEPEDRFGTALAAGDLDGNGQVDLVVGSPGEGPSGAPNTSGMISTFPDSPAGLEIGEWTTQEDVGGSSEAGDLFGSSLAVGNFNGDAFQDLAIGAPGEAPGSEPAGGYVFVQNGSAAPTTLSVGPILGAVAHDSIKVWVRANKEVNYKVGYTPTAGGTETQVNFGTLDDALDYTGTVTLTGLSANTQYNYRVLLSNVQHYAGTFRTLPSPGTDGQMVFTYGADLNLIHRPFTAVAEAASDAPRFMILGGDNMYADTFIDVSTKAGYEARYRQTFGDEELRQMMRQIPTFMMWDDHEIEDNWDSGSAAPYADARSAYNEYQGGHNPAPVTPGTIYYSFTAGRLGFFVLDTRSFRSANGATDGPSKTMLGKTQLDALKSWLTSPLTSSTATFKFIVSSVPFSIYGTTGSDAWEGFMTERNALFAFIRDNAIPGVVLLSGDQHWAGVFKMDDFAPYNFYEFMPTPVGTHNRNAPTTSNSEVIYANDAYVGYGRFTANTSVTPATLTYDWIDSTGTTRFTHTITTTNIQP